MTFRLQKTSKKSRARLGRLVTKHGTIPTPFFMPIATKAAVKGIDTAELHTVGTDIVLANTYHLWLRPGTAIIKRHGGLHAFMHWDGPILTDSGGYQVFSLAKHRIIGEKGVAFRDPVDGGRRFLTPEQSVAIQRDLGSDIIMVLDECPAYPVTKRYALASMDMTTRWAKRCLKAKRGRQQALFGIVQGSTFTDLRKQHAQEMAELPFDGFALGGLSVGEPETVINRMIDAAEPYLPKAKPRYVMGMGKPHQLVEAVKRGMDMFDCVLPTRDARHGRLYVWKPNGKRLLTTTRSFSTTMTIKNSKYARDLRAVDATCPCALCTGYSRAYLRHLFATNEPLGMRLATIHNLTFYLGLMAAIRKAIAAGKL